MLLLFSLLSLLVGVWASHPQAPGDGESVALFDNYYRMEKPDISLDKNTKRALLFTVELGCRNYVQNHLLERYESEAIVSRVYFSSLKSALQMFFPGCKVADLEDMQEHPSITSTVPSYVVTTAGKHGTGFYTDILSPRTWIRFDPSQPKASAHLRAFVERNSKCFDILHLQDMQRAILAEMVSLPNHIESFLNNDIHASQLIFWYVIAHTVQSALSATTPALYKEAIYKGLSNYFSELELHQYVFSPNASNIAMAPAFTVYKRDFPLILYTNGSYLRIKGCIPVHISLHGPSNTMGMVVANFPGQVFVIYFKSISVKALGVMLDALYYFTDKLKGFNLKNQDRFFELFEKKLTD